MGFLSWLEGIFKKVNPQHVAGALAAAKQSIDAVGAIEKWDWLPQFDKDTTTAITLLDEWKPGASTSANIQEAVENAVELVEAAPNISEKDKALIAVFTGVAESALALIGA